MRRRPLVRTAAAALALFLAGAAGAQKPIQIKGRFFGIAAQFKVRIDGFTTPEELAGLKEPLTRQDFKGFYEALWKLDKGYIQFIGVSRTNIHFAMIVEEKRPEGTRILCIADSRAVTNARISTDWGARPFYVVELTLDGKNEGEGRIHAAAQIDFPASGGVTLLSYSNEPQMLVNVRLLK